MICDECKNETNVTYEIKGYTGTFQLCESCFHGKSISEYIEETKQKIIEDITEILESHLIGKQRTDSLLIEATTYAESMLLRELPDGWRVSMINPHFEDDNKKIAFDGFTILHSVEGGNNGSSDHDR